MTLQPHTGRRGLCTRQLCAPDPATIPAALWPRVRPPRPLSEPRLATLAACQPVARRD